MPNVRYRLGASKSYNYQQEVLLDTSLVINASFTADVADAEAAGLVPYYRSAIGGSDPFFQSLINRGFEFTRSSVEPTIGENRDNEYSAWTETYSRIREKKQLHDLQITVNYPTWKLRFFNLVDYEQYGESRRMRQAYGYSPVSGALSGRVKVDPGPWDEWFLSGYNRNKIIVDNASTTEAWENGERVWYINLSWKAYELSNIPTFKEVWS